MDDREPFLSRWSRRKLEAKEDTPVAAPPAQPVSAAAAAEPTLPHSPQPAQPAQPPSERGPEYREFFDPQVDEKLRHAALKELFGDPHFNVMDGLDTYIDDYSIADPIPEAMLRQLNQAKELFLFDDEKQAGAGTGDAAPAATAADADAADRADLAAPTERPREVSPDADAGVAAGPVQGGNNA